VNIRGNHYFIDMAHFAAHGLGCIGETDTGA
jgi:hypothetical protein